jgi:hypothetical protein
LKDLEQRVQNQLITFLNTEDVILRKREEAKLYEIRNEYREYKARLESDPTTPYTPRRAA